MTRAQTVITIDKGIPRPKVKPRGLPSSWAPIYPWLQMEVGDSFLFPRTIKSRSGAHSLAAFASNKTGRKFFIASIEGRWRCWRDA